MLLILTPPPHSFACGSPVAVVKISLPSPSLAHPRMAPGPSTCKFFFLQVCNCSVVGKGKCVILKRGPFGQSLYKITAVISCNVDQSKPDSHFHSQIEQYFFYVN